MPEIIAQPTVEVLGNIGDLLTKLASAEKHLEQFAAKVKGIGTDISGSLEAAANQITNVANKTISGGGAKPKVSPLIKQLADDEKMLEAALQKQDAAYNKVMSAQFEQHLKDKATKQKAYADKQLTAMRENVKSQQAIEKEAAALKSIQDRNAQFAFDEAERKKTAIQKQQLKEQQEAQKKAQATYKAEQLKNAKSEADIARINEEDRKQQAKAAAQFQNVQYQNEQEAYKASETEKTRIAKEEADKKAKAEQYAYEKAQRASKLVNILDPNRTPTWEETQKAKQEADALMGNAHKQAKQNASAELHESDIPKEKTGSEGGYPYAAGYTLLGAGTAVLGAEAEIVQKGIDIEAEIRKIAATAGDTRPFAQIQADITTTAEKFGQLPGVVAQSMYTVESAGFKGAQGLTVLNAAASMARGTQGNLKDITDVVVKTLLNYNLGVDKAARVTNIMTVAVKDSLQPASEFVPAFENVLEMGRNAGASVEGLAAALATATATTKNATTASTYLKNMLNSMIHPNKALVDESKKLGLTWIANGDAAEHIRKVGLPEALHEIGVAANFSGAEYGKMFPDMRKVQFVMSALFDHGERLNRVYADMKTQTDAVGTANKVMDGSLVQTQKDFEAATQNFALQLEQILTPALTSCAKVLEGWIHDWEALPEPMKAASVGVGTVIAILATLKGAAIVIGATLDTLGLKFIGVGTSAAEGATVAEGAFAISSPWAAGISLALAAIMGLVYAYNKVGNAAKDAANEAKATTPQWTDDAKTRLTKQLALDKAEQIRLQAIVDRKSEPGHMEYMANGMSVMSGGYDATSPEAIAEKEHARALLAFTINPRIDREQAALHNIHDPSLNSTLKEDTRLTIYKIQTEASKNSIEIEKLKELQKQYTAGGGGAYGASSDLSVALDKLGVDVSHGITDDTFKTAITNLANRNADLARSSVEQQHALKTIPELTPFGQDLNKAAEMTKKAFHTLNNECGNFIDMLVKVRTGKSFSVGDNEKKGQKAVLDANGIGPAGTIYHTMTSGGVPHWFSSALINGTMMAIQDRMGHVRTDIPVSEMLKGHKLVSAMQGPDLYGATGDLQGADPGHATSTTKTTNAPHVAVPYTSPALANYEAYKASLPKTTEHLIATTKATEDYANAMKAASVITDEHAKKIAEYTAKLNLLNAQSADLKQRQLENNNNLAKDASQFKESDIVAAKLEEMTKKWKAFYEAKGGMNGKWVKGSADVAHLQSLAHQVNAYTKQHEASLKVYANAVHITNEITHQAAQWGIIQGEIEAVNDAIQKQNNAVAESFIKSLGTSYNNGKGKLSKADYQGTLEDIVKRRSGDNDSGMQGIVAKVEAELEKLYAATGRAKDADKYADSGIPKNDYQSRVDAANDEYQQKLKDRKNSYGASLDGDEEYNNEVIKLNKGLKDRLTVIDQDYQQQKRKDLLEMQKFELDMGKETAAQYQANLMSMLSDMITAYQASGRQNLATEQDIATLSNTVAVSNWSDLDAQIKKLKDSMDEGGITAKQYNSFLEDIRKKERGQGTVEGSIPDEHIVDLEVKDNVKQQKSAEQHNKELLKISNQVSDSVGQDIADSFIKAIQHKESFKTALKNAFRESFTSAMRDVTKGLISKAGQDLAKKVFPDHSPAAITPAEKIQANFKLWLDNWNGGMDNFNTAMDTFQSIVNQFKAAIDNVPFSLSFNGQQIPVGQGASTKTGIPGLAGGPPLVNGQIQVSGSSGQTAKSLALASNQINDITTAITGVKGLKDNSNPLAVAQTADTTLQAVNGVAKIGGLANVLGAVSPWIAAAGAVMTIIGMTGKGPAAPSRITAAHVNDVLTNFGSTVDTSKYSGTTGLRSLLGQESMASAGVRGQGMPTSSGNVHNWHFPNMVITTAPGQNGHQIAHDFMRTIQSQLAMSTALDNSTRGTV